MRIVIVTQEEPFVYPMVLTKVIEERERDVVGIVVLHAFKHKASFITIGREYLKLFGLREFLTKSFLFFYFKFLDKISILFPLKRFYSVKRVAKHFGIPVYYPTDINSTKFLRILRKELFPDVIVSIAATQIFKKEILDLPKFGCINVHHSLLPKYRGFMATFWMLAKGEKKTGVSIHFMEEKLDSGPIIGQVALPIYETDTRDSLHLRTRMVGASLLLKVLRQIENGKIKSKPNDEQKATYVSFPTKEAVDSFREQGRKFR